MQLVLFSDSFHLSASSDAEKRDWISKLQELIPRSSYDESDQLQMAALEKDTETFDIEYCPGSSQEPISLERRGNLTVSGPLSSKVQEGSVLSHIGGEPAMMMGYDQVVTEISRSKTPLELSFQLSPRMMGWLTLYEHENQTRMSGMVRKKHKKSKQGEFLYPALVPCNYIQNMLYSKY